MNLLDLNFKTYYHIIKKSRLQKYIWDNQRYFHNSYRNYKFSVSIKSKINSFQFELIFNYMQGKIQNKILSECEQKINPY